MVAAMFHVDSLSVSYPSPLGGMNCIVSDVHFELHRGDILGLLGFNGAGKSTLLKALAGACPVSSGRVQCDGVYLHATPIEYRELLGYQPELPCLPHAMTVMEFGECIGQLRGLSKTTLSKRLQKITTTLDLKSLMSVRCGHLSKGQKQRVGFMAATIHSPKLLLLDEPMAGLDPLQILAFRDIVKDEAEERVTILSTHDMHEIAELCSKILVLDKGHVRSFLLNGEGEMQKELFDFFTSSRTGLELSSTRQEFSSQGMIS